MELVSSPRLSLLLVAWFVADMMTPILVRLARRIGAVDKPREYKAHAEPTPYLGGVAILLAFAAGILSTLRFTDVGANLPLFAILGGAGVITLFGAVDDARPVHAVLKLVLILALTYLLQRFGVQMQLTRHEWLNLTLTLLWVAGVTSAMNSLDNTDGAAAGVSSIAAFFTFLVGWSSEPRQDTVSYFALALLGASLGFLRYNYAPARIFLGNNGAFLLGFLLASLSLFAGWSQGDPIKAIIVPCAVLIVPLYDITLSTILRINAGVVRSPIQAIIYCGRDHLAHRLMRYFGLSRMGAVNTMYLIGFGGGLLGFAISMPGVKPSLYLPLTTVGLFILFGLGILLSRARVYEKATIPINEPATDESALSPHPHPADRTD